jgi:hypothetical protein
MTGSEMISAQDVQRRSQGSKAELKGSTIIAACDFPAAGLQLSTWQICERCLLGKLPLASKQNYIQRECAMST